MPRRNAKGRFIKGGGGGHSKALVRHHTRTITKYRTKAPKKAHRRRGRGGGGAHGITLGKVIVGGLGVGFLLGAKTPAPEVKKFFADTIPGGKTFGPEATFGAIALGVDHFVWKNPWVRAAGLIGIGIAAIKLGNDRGDFKFLGAPDGEEFVADVD